MNMFLWTVGSFSVFGEQSDLARLITSRIQFVEKTLISMLMFCHPEFREEAYICEKGSYLLRRAFIFPGRAFIFLRFPLWKYGGLDSASSANRVC